MFFSWKIYLFIIIVILSGCVVDGPGKISNSGFLGETNIKSVENTETPATLSKDESKLEITHKDGDILTISSKNGFSPKVFSVKNEEGKTVKNTTYNEGWVLNYLPKEGATTSFIGVKTEASTGNTREDATAKIREQFENTKNIQHVGLALIVASIVIMVFFKSPSTAGVCGAAGVGMIILQSTLSNPIWAWAAIGVVIILPVLWFYSYHKNKSLSNSLIVAIEKYKEKHPEQKESLEQELRGYMDNSSKKLVKQIKTSI